jgi:signal transduction histidine kinase
MSISKIKTLVEQEKINRSTDVQSVINALETSLNEIRALTFKINPPILKHLGLVPAINWLIKDTGKKEKIQIRLNNYLPDTVNIPETIQAVLYRSIRELFINIQKHSNASKADITANIIQGDITVSVEDNGTGFDPDAVIGFSHGSYGLHSISTRMQHLGGDMEIYSSPGNGTNIILTVPLDRNN